MDRLSRIEAAEWEFKSRRGGLIDQLAAAGHHPKGDGLPARYQGRLQVSGEAGLYEMQADLEGLAVGHLVGVESASPVLCPPKEGSRLSSGPPALRTESLCHPYVRLWGGSRLERTGRVLAM